MLTLGVVAVLALGVGYLTGRARPWQLLGDWAVDQLRFGDAARGGRTRQAAVLLAHAVTHPVTSWRIWRTGPQEPAPVFVSQFAAGPADERKENEG